MASGIIIQEAVASRHFLVLVYHQEGANQENMKKEIKVDYAASDQL